MFIADLPVTILNWKQPEYPSVGKWLNWGTSVPWYRKGNEVWLCITTWMGLKGMMWSKNPDLERLYTVW